MEVENNICNRNDLSLENDNQNKQLIENGHNVIKEDEQQRIPIIIALGGAFNPIHTCHVAAMLETKSWIEANTPYNVISGMFAVAPDGYVKAKARKHGYNCIKAEHCIKLCKIASQEYSQWLKPYDKPVGSAKEAIIKAKSASKLESVHLGIVIGADRAINSSQDPKWRKDTDCVHLCVGRHGETEKVAQMYNHDKEDGLVNSEFYFISKELDGVSSTKVRQKLSDVRDGDPVEVKARTVRFVVDSGWICEAEADYIVNHWSEIYI